MKNKKICQIFMQKTGSQEIAKQIGIDAGYISLVVALYDDKTWEYIAAYAGPSYERHQHGKEPHLAMMLKGKTALEAREMVEKFFKDLNINGKILNLEES